MGNLQEHIIWSSFGVILLQSICIYYLLQDYFWTLILIPVFFIWGSVMPDVDLPRETWWRSLLFNLIFPIGGYIVGKKSVHWGKVHSIVFGIFLSSLLLIILLILGVNTDVSEILAISFLNGFTYHLIIDQAYHEYRTRRDGKVALKLFWNSNKDPLVWFFNHI